MLIKNLPKKENKHFLVLTSHKYHIQKKNLQGKIKKIIMFKNTSLKQK